MEPAAAQDVIHDDFAHGPMLAPLILDDELLEIDARTGELDDAISDAVSAEDGRLDRMKRQLRFTLIGIPTAWAVIAAIMWSATSLTRLVVWGLFTVVGMAGAIPMAMLARKGTTTGSARVTGSRSWIRRARLAQVAAAIGYGSLHWFAQPQSDAGHALALTAILAILVVHEVASGSNKTGHGYFLITFFLVAASSFMLLDNPLGSRAILLLGWCCVITFGHGRVNRSAAAETHRLGLCNAALTSHLRQERARLRQSNYLLALRANHDPLTGLANRGQFMQRLQEAVDDNVGTERRAGVIFIDFDHFKAINDTYGHSVGDQVLIVASRRIRADLDEDCTLARLGGDELVICVPAIESLEALRELGQRIAITLEEPLVLSNRHLHVSISVGVARSLRETQSGDELLRCADAALYKAKRNGRARVEVFAEKMEDDLIHAASAADDLRLAVSEGHIVPFYQPYVDLETGHILGAEALARWHHESGVRSAGSFIGLAAEIGLLRPISRDILRCVDDFRGNRLPAIESAGAVDKLVLSANIPPESLEQMLLHFGEDERSLDGLVVEITEVGVIHDINRIVRLLSRVRDAGAKIWLDDFGVASSSLHRVAQLPLDGIKLDRSFVSDLPTNAATHAVVSATMELAGRLGLTVVGEGIETHEQAAALVELGVTIGQGFLFSQAVPELDFTQMIVERRCWPVPKRSTL